MLPDRCVECGRAPPFAPDPLQYMGRLDWKLESVGCADSTIAYRHAVETLRSGQSGRCVFCALSDADRVCGIKEGKQ